MAGSTLLASGLVAADRTRIEGATDTLIWSSAAVASLGSGLVVAAAGFAALCLIALALLVAPIWVLISRRPTGSALPQT